MLPEGDYSPSALDIPAVSTAERLIKRPIRRFAYPLYNAVVDRWLRSRYGHLGLNADQWLWGQRGNDFERQRRRVNHFLPLKGRSVMVAGCGTGRDVPSWLAHHPGSVMGVDYFGYERMWNALVAHYESRWPTSTVSFRQADLTNLDGIQDGTFDVIGSDAVFEHVKDLPAVLREFYRVLRPGGVVYATYGPLWYCWGGDHISGSDDLANGYNHLLMPQADYEQYLDSLGEYVHSEHDGRTWIRHGLFSYLRPQEYLDALASAGFQRLYVGAIIEPRAIQCLNAHPSLRPRLAELGGTELDFIVTGMTILFRKPAA